MNGKLSSTALALLASIAFPATAKAAILNGGFEEGFNSWGTIGDYRIETSAFGSGSVQGNFQAFLSNANQEVIGIDNNFNPIIGGNAVGVSFMSGYPSLEEFLSLSTFFGDKSLDSIATGNPIEGSAIKQTFTADAGQRLSFSWNFLTNESVEQAAVDDSTYPNYNDFAFVTLQSDSVTQFFSLADTISKFTDSATGFGKETGFKTFSYTIPISGQYTLGIGVVDVGEPTRISALLVDEAKVVPEPTATLGILLFGALGTISVLKHRNNTELQSNVVDKENSEF